MKNKFYSFIKILLKKWSFFLLYYGGLLSLAITFRIFEKDIPSWIFWVLAFIGLLWASFKVYKDQFSKIRELQAYKEELTDKIARIEKPSLPSKISKKEPKLSKPELSIKLLEGNEYTYTLMEIPDYKKEKDEYILNEALITLNLRIENIGNIEMDMVLIEVNYNDTGFPWAFLLSKSFENGKQIVFPKYLDIGDIFICETQNSMQPRSYFNNAKFAANLAKLDKESCYVDYEITIEAKPRIQSAKTLTFTYKNKPSLRPLIDLYITKWQKDRQLDLIRLAQ